MISIKTSVNRKYTIGMVTCIALFYPLFGQSISVFGIHNRFLSLLFLIIAAMLSIKYQVSHKINRRQLIYFLLILVFLLIELLYSEGSQVYRLIFFDFRNEDFYESKLAITYLTILIPVIASFIIAPISLSKKFVDGFVGGFLILSTLAILVSINFSEYWFTNDYLLKSEYKESQKFSQISISVLHMLGMLYGILLIFKKKYALSFLLLSINMVFIIVYQQRSAWIYVTIIFIIIPLLNAKTLQVIKYSILMPVFMLGVFVIGAELGVFTDSVLGYAEQLLNGDVLLGRSYLYSFAWDGFLKNPLGSGYGSYAIAGPHDYPHNILLEALYELGIVSTLLLTIILFFTLKVILSSFIIMKKKQNINVMLLGLILGYLFLNSLKSGNLFSIEIMISLTMLFSNISDKMARSGERFIKFKDYNA